MKKIYGFAIASAALMLASCSSDVANEPVQPEGPAAGYLKINLEGLTAGTRADDAVTISSINFHFEKGGQNQDVVVNGATGDNKFISEDKKSVVVKVNFIPQRVRAVVNGTESSTLTATNGVPTDASLNTLSSACYVGTGVWTSVNANVIYNTADEAAASANKTVIYVDRSYARVDMAIADAAVDMSSVKFSNGTSAVDVTFKPMYVYVNGVATKADLWKSLPGLPATVQTLSLTEALVKNGATGSTRWAAGTAATWTWKNTNAATATQHYSIGSNPNGGNTEDGMYAASQKVYENTPSGGEATKDYTHVIVAGQYTVAGLATEADGSFYTFGTKDGKAVVYGTKAAVLAAMAGDAVAKADLKKVPQVNNDSRTTANYVLTIGGVEQPSLKCSKYDKGMVYYAAAIANNIKSGETTVSPFGIVRNHIYTVNIAKIAGFGIPIQDTTEEIIPEPEPEDNSNYFMQLNIVVNPMVNVEQEVEWNNNNGPVI